MPKKNLANLNFMTTLVLATRHAQLMKKHSQSLKALPTLCLLLQGLPQVRAVHVTNGQWDLIVEIGTNSLDQLDQILTQIRRFEGVAKSQTNLLLSTKKQVRGAAKPSSKDLRRQAT